MWAIYVFGAMLAVLVVWRTGIGVWLKTAEVYHHTKSWKLERRRVEGGLVERVHPGEDGLYPLLFFGGQVLDVNRGATFDLRSGLKSMAGHQNALSGDEIGGDLARSSMLSQVLRAGGGWPRPGSAGVDGAGLMVGVPDEATRWPDVVRLVDLFQSRSVTLNDLVVGVTVEDGERRVVSASLHRLMHVLSVGASGWGKSTWLRAFLWQLARCREAVEVVAIDPFGSEFNVLGGWGRLRWPVARTVGDAAAVLGAVGREVGRRRGLYEGAPMATNLVEYNRLATDGGLVPWVVVFDEGTAALNTGEVGKPLRDVVQSSRQYGIYVLLAGQSAKAAVVDTQTRDQFSTRLCFRTSPTSSRVVLDDRSAAGLTVAGRAMCQLTGRRLVELQGPLVSREEFVEALGNGGPGLPMPELVGRVERGLDEDVVARIMALHGAGTSVTGIAAGVFGHGNGFYIGKVREVLRQRQVEV